MIEKEDAIGWFNDGDSWKILTIDKDESTHTMAKQMMEDVEFENKSFEIFNAYSSDQALDILSTNKDIALIIMDPFSEDNKHGLQLIDDMRNAIGNSMARIIITTDTEDQDLKRQAVLDYDINGYEKKTRVLSDKFLTVVIPAIKCYKDIVHKPMQGRKKMHCRWFGCN